MLGRRRLRKGSHPVVCQIAEGKGKCSECGKHGEQYLTGMVHGGGKASNALRCHLSFLPCCGFYAARATADGEQHSSFMSRSRRSISRPRDKRDRTVPIGILRIAAASSYDMPSRPTSKITCRCPEGSLDKARSSSRSWREAVGSVVAISVADTVSTSTAAASRTPCRPVLTY